MRLAPWLAALAAAIAFFYLFSDVLLPFAVGIGLGYLLDPVTGKLQRLGLSRLGAASVILGIFVILLVGVILLLGPVLSRQLSGFVAALPQTIAKLQSVLGSFSDRLAGSWIGEAMARAGINLQGSDAPDVQKAIGDLMAEVVQRAGVFAKTLLSRGAALFSLLSLMVVTPIVAFYIIVDWNKMVSALRSLVPPRFRPDVREIAHEIDQALAGFVRGQSLVCLFLGLWYGVGLSLIGLNFGFLIGASAGVLSFIPYVGSLIALVVSAIVALVQGWPDWHMVAMAVGVVGVGQFLEGNFLSPYLVGHSVGLHPVWLMFALLAFGSLFGFTGLIIAVPAAAALGVILRFMIARYKETPFYTGEGA
ncbi:MAG: AI-2E family transporter [Hyphomicrobiales bacterium]|nr:AI-2E family transporter [Hyphomicrobiales bacterium]